MRHTDPSRATVRLVRDRDEHMCVLCYVAWDLQTHHRRPRQMGGSRWTGINLPTNLLTVCLRHHQAIEANREWALNQGLLVSQFEDPANVPVHTRHRGWVDLLPDGGMREIEWEGTDHDQK